MQADEFCKRSGSVPGEWVCDEEDEQCGYVPADGTCGDGMFIVQTKHHVNVRLDMDSCRILYGIAFTIKMSKKEDHQIDGYFDYVVPPLEGFWWQDGVSGIDYARKEDFKWISVIRLPDFVTREDFDWAVRKATAKKKQDFSKLSDRSVETCEAYRRGRACGSLLFCFKK